jgi:xanthine dehydrogenase molybdopterin binding subunit
LLPRDTVHYHGQIIALVVAQDRDSARRAARTVVVEYDPLPAIVTIDEALAQGATFDPPQAIRRGDCQGALDDSSHRLSGELRIPGQEHFYLESQAAWAARGDDDDMEVLSSTQHPSEAQETVADVLGLPANRVVVRSQRMGGAFGGKESQAHLYAAMAALAAWHTRRSACLQLDRDIDMQVTGKRHPALARYDAAFEPDGKVTALRVRFFLDAGFSLDLSPAILARTLFHADNAYFIPNLEVEGHLLRTNKASNTAFRGFGGPQGMLVIEEVMDRVARQLGLLPEEVRQRNLYHGTGETNRTHYGMDIGDNRLEQIWTSLRRDSELGPRRQAIAAFNAAQDSLKRGIAMTPVKFGISFTAAPLNQAGALVNVYRDGTAQVSIAGTEMGQGLNSKVRGVAMRELGLSARAVRVMCTSTEKVPNTSPTAGSTGADLNGAAVKVACETLRGRLASVFADLVADQLGRTLSAEEVLFSQDQVSCAAQPELKLPLAEVTTAAHQQRVSLSAVGYYRTPGIHYDPQLGRGKPFHYFACGAAVAEVEVDCRTGMWRLLAADILHDVGDSLNPQIDRGQIEGAFLQGTGWLTGEELLWDGEGRLLTHSASLYQIPGLNDGPGRFTVALLAGSSQANTVHGSKAVGEPPFMLAFSVREAIREAVAAFGDQPAPVELPIPATVEAIHWAIGQQSSAKR